MGEPAELGAGDREVVHALAWAIVVGVSDDITRPLETLRVIAGIEDVPMETLVLWMAQELLRNTRHERSTPTL